MNENLSKQHHNLLVKCGTTTSMTEINSLVLMANIFIVTLFRSLTIVKFTIVHSRKNILSSIVVVYVRKDVRTKYRTIYIISSCTHLSYPNRLGWRKNSRRIFKPRANVKIVPFSIAIHPSVALHH